MTNATTTNSKTAEIRARLEGLQDLKYRDFQLNLMPGVDPECVLGVRVPLLRKYAKELYRAGEYQEFLADLPHETYDEMNLHGFILGELSDYDQVVAEIDRFLPYVDNWATCDLLRPRKAFRKNLDRLLADVQRWMVSDRTYTIRFGMEMLMTYFMDEAFEPEYLQWVADVSSDEYYVNMMRAWYFATALTKQYEAAVSFIERHVLDDWTHRKSIQKAVESRAIPAERKEYLKTFRSK